jgi:hypothetical protein
MKEYRQLKRQEDVLSKYIIIIQNEVTTQKEKVRTYFLPVIREIGNKISNIVNTIKSVVDNIRING